MKKMKIAFAVAVLSALCSFSVATATDLSPTIDIETLKKAAINNNDADAAFSLCNDYSNGRGVAKDEVEADKWCKKSSQIVAQKSAEPLSNLEPAR